MGFLFVDCGSGVCAFFFPSGLFFSFSFSVFIIIIFFLHSLSRLRGQPTPKILSHRQEPTRISSGGHFVTVMLSVRGDLCVRKDRLMVRDCAQVLHQVEV